MWIALEDGRVVGQIAVQEALLQVEDQTFPAGWIVDVMVLPSHRGGGLGGRIYEAVAEDVDILVTLTMAEPTRRMAERLGCITLGDVRQFSRWTRLTPEAVRRYLLARTIYHPWAHTMATVGCRAYVHHIFPWIANPLLYARDLRTRGRRGSGATTFDEVPAFGEEIDRLWERTRGDYPVIFPRDTKFLNWRFVELPGFSYRRFVASRDGETVGYVVLRHPDPVELPVGTIVDLYAARADTQTIEDLVRYSLGFFGDDVAAVDCATSISEFEAVLRRQGFHRTRTERPTCVCRDDALRARLDELSGRGSSRRATTTGTRCTWPGPLPTSRCSSTMRRSSSSPRAARASTRHQARRAPPGRAPLRAARST